MSQGNVMVDGKYPRPVVDCAAANDGRTKQSFLKQTNINSIVARYVKTGLMDHVSANPGVFADVSAVGDYQGMLNKVISAKEAFTALPANLRSRFNHDPAQLIEFVSDESNRDEAIKLGIIPKPKAAVKSVVKEPVVAPVVSKPAVPVEPKVAAP